MDKKEWDQKYKDRLRHDGKRKILLQINGPKCSMCGEFKEKSDICVHHLIDKFDHRFQILLCRSCHAKVHASEKKPIELDDLKFIIESKGSIDSASKEIGISRSTIRKKLKKYGLYFRKCRNCGEIFKPTQKRYYYCSDECSLESEKKFRKRQFLKHREHKKEHDKIYYLSHREERIEKQKQYYQRNREKILDYHRQYELKKKSN